MNDDQQEDPGSRGPASTSDPSPSVPPPPPAEPTPARAAKAAAPDDRPATAVSFEPAPVSATPTGPLAPSTGAGPTRRRWVVAGLIALVVVALTTAGLFALVGATNASLVSAWTPADSVVYLEVRGDLPGDQRQNLGRFLAHFPGFADQATLDQKIDESLDRLIDGMSGGKRNWSSDIKPWFGGQLAVSLSSFPTMAGTDPAAGMADTYAGMADAHALVVATQKDPVAAIAWLKTLSSGAVTDESYKGVTLTVWAPGSGPKVAATATSGVLLIGDVASVKSAVDRDGKNGLAASAAFSGAMSGLDGDQATRAYVDVKAYLDAVMSMTGSTSGTSLGLDQAVLDRIPGWVGMGGRIESDALVGETVAPVVDGAPTVVDSESVIARHAPASTLAVVETHDFGKLFAAQLDQLRTEPALADGLKQVDQAAAVLGGLDHLTGWIGDVGVVVTADGSTPGGGLVIVPTDLDQANQIVTQLKNLIALAGGSSGITIRDEAYGSGTITTIDLGDLGKLADQATGGSGSAALPISGPAEVSFTVQGGVAIVGTGPAWVKSIVDVKAGSSLADQARYRDALTRVGSKNATSVFIDLAAIRTLVEPLVAKDVGASYATDVKPYLAPFDILAGASRTSDGKTISRLVLTVTK
jgi:Protein of unknown function (DUF3352)